MEGAGGYGSVCPELAGRKALAGEVGYLASYLQVRHRNDPSRLTYFTNVSKFMFPKEYRYTRTHACSHEINMLLSLFNFLG